MGHELQLVQALETLSNAHRESAIVARVRAGLNTRRSKPAIGFLQSQQVPFTCQAGYSKTFNKLWGRLAQPDLDGKKQLLGTSIPGSMNDATA
jgi:hypothetical protein